MKYAHKPGRSDEHDMSTRQYEKLPVHIFADSRGGSLHVAVEIAQLIRQKKDPASPCVLGLSTGSTPLTVYGELVRMHREEGLSFGNVVTFNLDEYYPMEPGAMQSYVRFMKENFFNLVDIRPENIHIPDGSLDKQDIPEFCRRYEEAISARGGIDLQLLGIGRTGHIGFNEPGSSVNSATRLITLDHITIADAAGDFYGEENVPRHAITMGIGTIRRAKKILLMAWGEAKAPIVTRAVEGPVSGSVPASYLQEHPDASFIVDAAAAAELTRSKTPWLVRQCDWNDNRFIRRGVVWLCREVKKPILKLTDRDYNDHGLGDLIAIKGSAYSINIRVFNDLQHTITGWPGGKPDADDTYRPEKARPYPKKALVFSPHPDDDVISMGGTIHRLVDQGHEVHIAYQTSGNIAVFDHDVIRYLDFIRDMAREFGVEHKETDRLYRKVYDFLMAKKPDQVDIPEVQTVKTLVRRGEAKAACRYLGIAESRVHFLDLPFYQTGTVVKKKLSADDIALISETIKDLGPHQIYAAGDLSDPHGTHRMCLEAVTKSLEALRGNEWLKDCSVWLYRGAWQEWDLADVDMAVPLSPSELGKKRGAIFRHQSQKDRPLFPGVDSREFWQRAEQRNRATARLYDELGMAEYEAMEVFKRYLP
ncbi:MAG TPA: glucosamine-6-phosphate deaminase [Spirochaetes bacterium]|nr:glucosamine-6-phosphate deaminase [Spirochaetota bacterium]